MNVCYEIPCLIVVAYILNIKVVVHSVDGDQNNKIFDYDEENDFKSIECPDEIRDFCRTKFSDNNAFLKSTHKNQKPKNERTPLPPLYDTINNVPCQCQMAYRLMDLGSGIYPRYIHTGVCKKNTCGLFHRCQPKKYKVRVLKRSGTDADIEKPKDDNEPRLSEPLFEGWIPDHINIIISCECLPFKI